MAENLSKEQTQLVNLVGEDNLVLVQFVGAGGSAWQVAPSPSGELYDLTNGVMPNYGFTAPKALLFVLPADAKHKNYYKASSKKSSKSTGDKAPAAKTPTKKAAKKPAAKGVVTVER